MRVSQLRKALPPGQYPIRELGPEHPIYRTLFPVAEIPQVPSMQFWRMTGPDVAAVPVHPRPGYPTARRCRRSSSAPR